MAFGHQDSILRRELEVLGSAGWRGATPAALLGSNQVPVSASVRGHRECFFLFFLFGDSSAGWC